MIRLIVLSAFVAVACAITLEEAFSWKQLDFQWPSPEAKDAAIKSKQFIQANNLPLGLDIHNPSKRLFITVPRWKAGVAASLSYVKIDGGNKSPELIPYPSWEANTIPDGDGPKDGDVAINSGDLTEEGHGRDSAPKAKLEDGQLANNATIISTFRIRVDECDRLWVLDTGLADILGNPRQIAKQAIVIFDLKTDRLIRRFSFQDSDIKEDSFFANVIVDTKKDKCDDAYAYVPDLGAYGLVVYSLKEDKSWRVKHNYFYFEPLAGEYAVGGVNFQWTDGIFGVALSPFDKEGYRTAYFHALSSTKEFKVSTKVLQNETYCQSSEAFHEFELVGDRGERSQSSASFVDPKTGVLFYTQVNKDGVNCWNTAKPYTVDTQGVVSVDPERLVFPNDLKVDAEDNLWVLSDKMPQFIYKSLNLDSFNYRILKAKVADAIANTVCVA